MQCPKSKSSGELRTLLHLKQVAAGDNQPEVGDRGRSVKERKADLEDATHKEVLLTEPLFELSGERILKTILGYPEQSPCICLAETFYYPARPTTYIFWDVEEIMKIGLPP